MRISDKKKLGLPPHRNSPGKIELNRSKSLRKISRSSRFLLSSNSSSDSLFPIYLFLFALLFGFTNSILGFSFSGEMAKSNRSKSSSERIIGKGEVTPIQVAYLVDRYLCDNGFSKTRSLFRSEASSLISNSPIRHVSKLLIYIFFILFFSIKIKIYY